MKQARRSFGGAVVEGSLSHLGYDIAHPSVALVETARPKKDGYEVVLAQNAWNFLGVREFARLAAPYPSTMRRRMVARRMVARVVLARAARVVCLTDFMATLVRQRFAGEVVVSPVTLPLDFATQPGVAPTRSTGSVGPRVLVPGTVTWYKRPHLAIEWILEHADPTSDLRLLFAGRRDDSGAAERLVAQAERSGLRADFDVLARDAMIVAMRNSDVVILPSELESLGFGLAEALVTSKRVIASPIASHREVAQRLGVHPEWLGETTTTASRLPSAVDAGSIVEQWDALARVLGLVKGDAATESVRS